MVSIWGITDKGAVRPQNQDYFTFRVVDETCAYGVVCDGMGGALAGNVASQMAVEILRDVLEQQSREDWEKDPGEVLRAAAEQANEAVFRRASVDSDCRGMGTTMVAAMILGHKAHLLNIGDSRAYYITEAGITRVTRDHSLVEDLVYRGKLTPEEARQHPQKNLITRALGAEMKVRADLYEQEMQEGSFLLLCSDGLSNVLSDQELLYAVIHGGEGADCCGRRLEVALHRGAPDNVTAVLIQL